MKKFREWVSFVSVLICIGIAYVLEGIPSWP